MSTPQKAFVIPDHTDDLKTIKDELVRLRSLLEEKFPAKDWLTVDEYAAYIGRSPRTVRRLVLAGHVQTKRIGNTLMIKGMT